MVSDSCLSVKLSVCLSVCPACPLCDVGILWPNGFGWIKVKLGTQVGLGLGHTVLDRNPAPPPQKRSRAPGQFSAHVYCGQTAGWIKMPLSMEVELGPGHIELDGDKAPPPQKGAQPPNFRPISVVAKWLDGSRCHLVGR